MDTYELYVNKKQISSNKRQYLKKSGKSTSQKTDITKCSDCGKMTKLCCPKYGKNITSSMFRSRGIKHDHGKSIKHNKYDIQQINKSTIEI